MHFQYKGKRILVPVFAITPLIVSTLLTKAVEENFFEHKFHGNVYQVVLGIAIMFVMITTMRIKAKSISWIMKINLCGSK